MRHATSVARMASSSSSQCASCWPEPGPPVPALSAVVSLRLCAEYAMPTPRATLTGRELGRLRGGARPAMLGGSLYVGQRGGGPRPNCCHAAARLVAWSHGWSGGWPVRSLLAETARAAPACAAVLAPADLLPLARLFYFRKARTAGKQKAGLGTCSLPRPAGRSLSPGQGNSGTTGTMTS